MTGSGEAHRGTLERLATRLEQAVYAGRSAAAVGLQPLGGLRGPQRRRKTGSRPDLPIDQFAEDLGPGRGVDLALHWFETELLTKEENLIGLMALNRETLGHAESLDSSDRVVLDMDSSESPVHSEQEGSAYRLARDKSA